MADTASDLSESGGAGRAKDGSRLSDTSRVRVGPSAIDGLGVFATGAFAPDETVLTLDDSRIVSATRPLRPEDEEHEHHRDFWREVAWS